MRSSLRSVGLALALTVPAAALHAETTLCNAITSAPYTITAPGIYCLHNSVIGGVSIQASDVVLDLNGHTLESPTPGSGSGVSASDDANITVRNGTLRGFAYGIQIVGKHSRSHLIERLRIMDSSESAIRIYGDGTVLRHNMLLNNGYPAPGARFVIYANGDGIHIADNQVIESGVAVATGEVVGIRTHGSGIAVERNVVSNAVVGSINSAGIRIFPAGPNSVVGNRVVNMKYGIDVVSCPTCSGATVFMDNTVGGATTPFSGGVMAGTTNTSF